MTAAEFQGFQQAHQTRMGKMEWQGIEWAVPRCSSVVQDLEDYERTAEELRFVKAVA